MDNGRMSVKKVINENIKNRPHGLFLWLLKKVIKRGSSLFYQRYYNDDQEI
jgi:hypothetical protein